MRGFGDLRGYAVSNGGEHPRGLIHQGHHERGGGGGSGTFLEESEAHQPIRWHVPIRVLFRVPFRVRAVVHGEAGTKVLRTV